MSAEVNCKYTSTCTHCGLDDEMTRMIIIRPRVINQGPNMGNDKWAVALCKVQGSTLGSWSYRSSLVFSV